MNSSMEKKNKKDSYNSYLEIDILPLIQFTKFNNFQTLAKNLSNFVPPAWKLDNPYYHNCLCLFYFEIRFCSSFVYM